MRKGKIRSRALLSVHRKEGLKELAEALLGAGCELVSSGGTRTFLESCGLPVTPVETVTGNPEAFGGRMKTLSFQIESAILFDRENPTHVKEALSLNIVPIDFVICNFYPFENAFSEKLPLEKAVELIDVGGPAMARSAAKNFKHVVVLTDPADYGEVERLLREKGEVPPDVRFGLACKAFHATARYDAQIDRYFHEEAGSGVRWYGFHGGTKLRYGENPHQAGFAFWDETGDPLSLENFKQIWGKEISFNNYLDMSGAINAISALGGEKPACVIVKHANPCGAAIRGGIEDAFEKAWEGDPLAAFGGIAALNRSITLELVENFLSGKRFAEVFLAPGIEEKAFSLLASKKKNLILMINPSLSDPPLCVHEDLKKIRGGVLVQNPDLFVPGKDDLEVVSKRSPSDQEWNDLLFAWKITKELKSNSIALAREEQLVGSGAGQQDRLRACRLAVQKAGDRTKGSCAASDAFFPFPDGPGVLAGAGVSAIIHPGGSVRDEETIQVCDANQVALVTTRGKRAFKH